MADESDREPQAPLPHQRNQEEAQPSTGLMGYYSHCHPMM